MTVTIGELFQPEPLVDDHRGAFLNYLNSGRVKVTVSIALGAISGRTKQDLNGVCLHGVLLHLYRHSLRTGSTTHLISLLMVSYESIDRFKMEDLSSQQNCSPNF
jgi:hypothetical protein